MRLLVFSLLTLSLAAQVPTAKEALSMQRPLNSVISPDGKYVAYVLSRTNWEDNVNESDIYLAEISTGRNIRLTAGRKSSSAPNWSKDSRRLAFLSNREGKQQIYILHVEGGEATQLTDHETGITDFDWTDPNSIYFLAAEPESQVAKDRKKTYGDLTIIDEDFSMNHLWRLKVSDTPKQKAERITEGDFHIGSFAVSPNGKLVALVSKRNPDLSTLGAKIEILNVADKTRRTLVETRNSFGNLNWGTDSLGVAYTTTGEVDNAFYANSYIAVQGINATIAKNVTPEVFEQPQIVTWHKNGILYLTRWKTGTAAFLCEPGEASSRKLNIGEGWSVTGVTMSEDLQKVTFIGNPPNANPEVYFTLASQWDPKPITSLKQQWSKFKPAKREVISWKSQDGATIEGVLITPAGFDRTKKHPLLVVIHGGPTGIDVPVISPDSIYPIEQFSAKGAVILRPNYRGSAGYGAQFRALNVRNLGVGDAWDVLSGVDHLIQQGFVDPEKVGSMGWSQGGYITAFLATAHASRFKAFSVGAGISNWVTYYVNTDIHPFTRQYLKATPWEDPEIYKKTSPITYINQAKSPVLIQHGDNDKRVPPPNAFELYQGLKDRGVPTRLVLYKGFGHGINKPKEAQHVIDENLNWFTKYVLN